MTVFLEGYCIIMYNLSPILTFNDSDSATIDAVPKYTLNKSKRKKLATYDRTLESSMGGLWHQHWGK